MSSYVNKTNPATLGIGIGDILKYEATPLTRVSVTAPANTKAGALVAYPLRAKPLVALTDEADGKVVVQPHNCIINLDHVSEAAIATALGSTEQAPKDVDDLIEQGDSFGIVYVGTPKA